MRRRDLIVGFGSLAVSASPEVARTQKQPSRIGFLGSGSPSSPNSAAQIDAIKLGLRENGLTEGQDYLLDARFVAGDYKRFPELARDLSQSGASIMLASTISAVRAAQGLTPAMPVVMLATNDPVGSGLVASLAQPGGLTTGVATLNQDLTTKIFEVQREIVPRCKVTAILFNPANPSNPLYVEKIRAIANASDVAILPVELVSPEHLGRAFDTIAARAPDSIQIVADAGTFDLVDRIAAFSLVQKLPSFATMPEFSQFGGLAAYGPSMRRLFVRGGYFVRRIIDGTRPADLPVEQPTRIDLIINQRTATALGVSVPRALLARADEVIE